MGMFSKDYEKETEELWNDVEKNLRPKDGFQHVLMINSFSSSKVKLACKDKCAPEYISTINPVIERIQKYGYEIIDIKIVSDEVASIRTLIIYK